MKYDPTLKTLEYSGFSSSLSELDALESSIVKTTFEEPFDSSNHTATILSLLRGLAFSVYTPM
jgi:hypothetical protein